MTDALKVQRRDVAHDAYVVEAAHGTALVPECLMDRFSNEMRPSHQSAYEWIGAHRTQITKAITALRSGQRPKPPYDIITLIEET